MTQPAPDELDRVRTREPWPPRYSGGSHREGQIIPHRFSIFSWLKAVPAVVEPFLLSKGATEVPDEFWSLDELDDGSSVAVISCPCGESPIVEHGRFHPCPGDDCPRIFLNLGNAVRVVKLTDEQLGVLAGIDPDS